MRPPPNLPRLGLGAAPLGNLYAPVSEAEAEAVLDAASLEDDALIDTAPYYGHGLSERRIGDFLAAHPDRAPLLSTKVGRRLEPCDDPPDHGFVDPAPFRPVFDYSGRGLRDSLESSLDRLGRDAVDLLLLHDIGRLTHGEAHEQVMDTVVREAWPTLRRLKAEGRAALIGFGVNECEVVLEALELGMVPDVLLLAGRHTLLDTGAERSGLLKRCRALGVVVIAAAPFNSGLLAGGGQYDYAAAPSRVAAAARRLEELCDSFGVPLPAAALQFPLRHPAIGCVVAGARSLAEQRQQRIWLDAPIPEDLWRALDAARAEAAA